MNPTRWIALHCGDESETLLARHPNAFLLLCQIAMRARWKSCPIKRLEAGEAFIGDWKDAGLHSEMAYRCAKKVLKDCGLATFKGTNKGTVASLTSTTIFSISAPANNAPASEPKTMPAASGERTGIDPTTTIHKGTKETSVTPSTLLEPACLPEVPSSGRRFPDHAALQVRIGALRAEWTRPVHWGATELHHLHAALGQFEELQQEDWEMLKRFLAADLDQAAGYWQPHNRSKFVETFSDVMASATRWQSKKRTSGGPALRAWEREDYQPAPAGPPVVIPREETNSIFKEFGRKPADYTAIPAAKP